MLRQYFLNIEMTLCDLVLLLLLLYVTICWVSTVVMM